MSPVAEAIAANRLGGTLWLYSNYHCNLSCSYCFTESTPRAAQRLLGKERMLQVGRQAADIGFRRLGVCGGEPFLLPEMPELLAELAGHLPVVVLTNATLCKGRLLERLRPLGSLPVTFQVSLDWADALRNDAARGSGNRDAVVSAIPRLRELGITVRVATTGGASDPAERQALCDLHLGLGVPEEDHVVRPVIRRGNAANLEGAVQTGTDNLPPELTVTADGAFWSPFGPAVRQGRVDTDLLITRTISPVRVAADALLALIVGRPAGADALTGIQ